MNKNEHGKNTKQNSKLRINKYIHGTCNTEELNEAFSIFEKPYRNRC